MIEDKLRAPANLVHIAMHAAHVMYLTERCDLCGEQILTPTLAPLIVEVGPVTLMGGVCRECRQRELGAL